MKKIYTLVFCLSLFTMAAKAQLSYGLKAGVNVAEEHFSSDQFTTSSHLAFNGGAFLNYQTKIPVSLQLELFYSSEGTKETSKSSGTKGTIREGYLNIPLLAQYKTPFGVYVETGPQLGFLLTSKEDFGTTTNDDIKKYYNSTDFSWCFGAGYELLTGPAKGLGLNVRYAPGLTTINKEAVGGGKLKNNVLSIDLTYRFSVGKKK